MVIPNGWPGLAPLLRSKAECQPHLSHDLAYQPPHAAGSGRMCAILRIRILWQNSKKHHKFYPKSNIIFGFPPVVN
jgi:hypothetical protein